jgi:hypothetical protein
VDTSPNSERDTLAGGHTQSRGGGGGQVQQLEMHAISRKEEPKETNTNASYNLWRNRLAESLCVAAPPLPLLVRVSLYWVTRVVDTWSRGRASTAEGRRDGRTGGGGDADWWGVGREGNENFNSCCRFVFVFVFSILSLLFLCCFSVFSSLCVLCLLPLLLEAARDLTLCSSRADKGGTNKRTKQKTKEKTNATSSSRLRPRASCACWSARKGALRARTALAAPATYTLAEAPWLASRARVPPPASLELSVS